MTSTQPAACVAVETSLFAQGMPRPDNFRLACDVAAAVRERQAEPRFVAIAGGTPVFWDSPKQLAPLCENGGAWPKATVADLALLAARRANAATTVATTALLAHRAGIRVAATGGIGGVHRDFARLPDVSADLPILARTPVIVVCSGIKSLLDVRATHELLETLGVPVVGFGTEELPGFYTARTGIALRWSVASVRELAEIWHAHRQHDLPGGLLIVQPPPEEHALPPEMVEAWVSEALADAKQAGLDGAAVTPFVLRRMAELSEGRTVQTNYALVVANACLAAELAVELAGGA